MDDKEKEFPIREHDPVEEQLTDAEAAEVDVAPEEEQLKGILPQATPPEGPAPLP